jgi:hypothetical protein
MRLPGRMQLVTAIIGRISISGRDRKLLRLLGRDKSSITIRGRALLARTSVLLKRNEGLSALGQYLTKRSSLPMSEIEPKTTHCGAGLYGF